MIPSPSKGLSFCTEFFFYIPMVKQNEHSQTLSVHNLCRPVEGVMTQQYLNHTGPPPSRPVKGRHCRSYRSWTGPAPRPRTIRGSLVPKQRIYLFSGVATDEPHPPSGPSRPSPRPQAPGRSKSAHSVRLFVGRVGLGKGKRQQVLSWKERKHLDTKSRTFNQRSRTLISGTAESTTLSLSGPKRSEEDSIDVFTKGNRDVGETGRTPNRLSFFLFFRRVEPNGR